MNRRSLNLVYLIFFLSGIAGLIYEIVWGRQLVLIFGSTTNSVVATISAFLSGLAIGSLLFGYLADRLSEKQLINLYSLLELGVGVTAGLTLILLPGLKTVYALVSDGSSISLSLLLIKFFLTILVLILPTVLMGGTLPILVRFLQFQHRSISHVISRLYSVNTFGAVLGVLFSAFILIELLGLTYTILIAVSLNVLVAVLARFISVTASKSYHSPVVLRPLFITTILPVISYSLSGAVAIAYEIIWVRILTPTVGTFIYAFAAILSLYLLGLVIGSFIYPYFSRIVPSRPLAFALCQLGIGFFTLGSVYLTSNLIVLPTKLMILSVILPATIFMGLAFPVVIALINPGGHAGALVGLTYFSNTLGSVLGGFLASFLFIPLVGSSQSLIILSTVNFSLALIFAPRWGKTIPAGLAILALWLFLFKRQSLYPNEVQWRINWARSKNIEFVFAEDEVASVFGYHDQKMNDYNLFIDGVPTTGKVGETKLMAHIPILLHPNPENVLVIAFGMGTTYRSSLLYEINTDVVELVPSVPSLMSLFHPDANRFFTHPQGKIIINDGRNYIFLTKKKYDIVTIDPPPPFNAAGTTVLYSQDFYQEIARKLTSNGVVSQWLWFGSREDDIKMAAKSFLNVFPYVLVFQTPAGSGGIFLEGSFQPFDLQQLPDKIIRLSPQVNADIQENYQDFGLNQLSNLIIGDRSSLIQWVGNLPPVTDNYPRTEYFFLRHIFNSKPTLVGQPAVDVIK